jgi:hypothetical protein
VRNSGGQIGELLNRAFIVSHRCCALHVDH